MEQILTDLSKQIKAPTSSTRLWKDECSYSFDTPDNREDGLFIDLKSFLSVSKKFLQLNSQKTGNVLYLNYKKVLIPSNKSAVNKDENQPPPKKLAIGVDGGFNLDDEDEVKYRDEYRLYYSLNDEYIPIDSNVIQAKSLKDTIEKVINMNSQSRKEEILQWNASQVFPSAYAESIVQINNGIKIPSSNWSCSVGGCDKKENLWLNLTDGFIGCGRKQADGSGGNGHAQQHYDETKYPISVKLGTITKDAADVYSYPEGEMVSDPLLHQHLAHFGINPKELSKTEKTMAELDLDYNASFEFGRIQEKGKDLENLFGPGLTGIENLGNSCYMSSVLQMIYSLDSFQKRYLESRDKSFSEITQDPSQSFEIQMSKLAHGLQSGEYSIPVPSNKPENKEEYDKASQVGIAPKMFKSLVGGNHPEFSTNKQQDALEYFQYLLSYVDRSEKSRPSWIKSENPIKGFNFLIEDRIQCGTSSRVKYTQRIDNVWSLPVPLEAATNKPEVEEYESKINMNPDAKKDLEEVRPRIPLQACIDGFLESYKVDDFYSSAINGKTFSVNSSKLATFPDTLVIHLRKYIIDNNYVPKKLNVFMDIPDEIDITNVRGKGKKADEELLPEDDKADVQQKPQFEVNLEASLQLQDMGFNVDQAKKALTVSNNDVAAAMDWLMDHANDPMDISPTIAATTPSVTSSGHKFNQQDVDSVCEMGFSADQAKLALKSTSNNIERAIDWLFSHVDELDILVAKDKSSSSSSAPTTQSVNVSSNVNDGNGKYKLLGFISHIGSNVHFGHYVCHIKKNGRWTKFNDRHVQASEEPPKEIGYIYFYQRC